METKVLVRKPCSENLHKMPRVAGGVFCTRCQLHVRDLTTFDAEAFAGWKEEIRGKKACGIFRKDQVTVPFFGRLLVPIRFAAVSILAFFFVKQGFAKSEAKFRIAEKNFLKPVSLNGDSVVQLVRGKTLTADSAGIPYVHVRAIYQGKTVADALTDSDGSFELSVPCLPGQSFSIAAGSFDYKAVAIFNYVPSAVPLTFILQPDENKRIDTERTSGEVINRR
jgi:hypothetical protein